MEKPTETIFETGQELLQAAQRMLGRSLTSEDLQSIDPDGTFALDAPYSDEDLKDFISLARDKLGIEPVSAEKRQRLLAMARVRREAAEARWFVEEQRLRLFGQTGPPCIDALEASRWLVDNYEEGETGVVRLEFVIPRSEYGVKQLIAARDVLDEVLSFVEKASEPERAYRDWKRNNRSIRTHGAENWFIPYFKFADEEDLLSGTFHTLAFPDTKLGHLYEKMRALAKATRWSDTACVHHLLTGGLMSSPIQSVIDTPAGSHSFASPYLELTIRDPLSVSEEEVLREFRARRGDLVEWMQPSRTRKRKRARGISAPELVPFVRERADLSWKAIWEQWNPLHPERPFSSSEALRKAFERAKPRSY